MGRRAALSATATLLLSACATRPDSRIGPHGIDVIATAGGQPTIVFENGLGATLAGWAEVLAGLPPNASRFAYDRPGNGRSGAAATPRDGATIVAELRAVLAAEGFRPPYVLVGHSLGGLYMQLFARAHPEEVEALILVDSTHPRQFKGDGALERQPWWMRSARALLVRGAAADELAMAPETGRQVLAMPPPGGVRVIVLSARKPMQDASSDAGRRLNAMRADLARLYPGARQIWVDSGHAMPTEAPAAILDAILAVLGRTSLAAA